MIIYNTELNERHPNKYTSLKAALKQKDKYLITPSDFNKLIYNNRVELLADIENTSQTIVAKHLNISKPKLSIIKGILECID